MTDIPNYVPTTGSPIGDTASPTKTYSSTDTYLQNGGALSNGQIPTMLAPTGQPSINSTSIAPQTPIVPEQPTGTPPPAVPPLSTPPITETPSEGKQSDIAKQLQTLNLSMEGRSAAQTQAENDAGLPAFNATVKDLTARSNALSKEALAIPLQLQQDSIGRGITAGGLAPIQAGALRENTIAALGVNSLLEAAHGNVTYAQSLADKAVKAQFDPIQEKIDALTKNLNLIKNDPQSTVEEKNRAQQQLDIQKANQDKLDQQKADRTQTNTIGLEAAKNIKTFKPTPEYPTAAQALDAISKAATPAAAQAIASATGLVTPVKLDTSVVEIGGRKVLVNTQTGATIKDLGAATGGGGNLTPTQINNGAVKAGLSTVDFAALPQDVKTYFSQKPQADIDAITGSGGLFEEVKNGTKTPAEVKAMIDTSNNSQPVKDYWDARLAKVTSPTATQSNSNGLFGWGFWGL